MAVIHWYNRWDAPLGELDLVDAQHSESLDGEDALELTCTDQAVSKGDRLVWKSPDGLWHEHVVDTVHNRRRDGMPVTELKCIGSMAYDLSHAMMQDSLATSLLTGRTVAAAVTNILSQDYHVQPSDVRWTAGTCSSASLDIDRTDNQAVVDKMSVLMEIASTGIEVYPTYSLSGSRITARRVNAVEQRGDQTAQWRFQWASEADAISRKVLGHDPVSRLYVYGKVMEFAGGVKRRLSIADHASNPYRTPEGDVAPYMESTAALNQWGLPDLAGTGKVPTADVVFFEEAESAYELWQIGLKAWYEMRTLRVSYEVDALRLADGSEVSLGDSVQVVDTGMTPALRATGRIVRLARDLMTGEATATVGANDRTLPNRFMDMQSRSDSIDRRLSAVEGL